MYLVVGATGQVGRVVTRRLLAAGHSVRAMTRAPEQAEARALAELGVQVVQGDLRDAASLARACQGVARVVAAARAFPGRGRNNPRTVDGAGTRHLIDAARSAGVHHFVYLSALGVHPEHPCVFHRTKHEAEVALHHSGMSFTILRPAPLLECWLTALGRPIMEKGRATVAGGGWNRIPFVSVHDVAAYTLVALGDFAARNRVIEVGGPEPVTPNQIVALFEALVRRRVRVRHRYHPPRRAVVSLVRPFRSFPLPQVMSVMAVDGNGEVVTVGLTQELFPLELTPLEDVARRLVAEWAAAEAGERASADTPLQATGAAPKRRAARQSAKPKTPRRRRRRAAVKEASVTGNGKNGRIRM